MGFVALSLWLCELVDGELPELIFPFLIVASASPVEETCHEEWAQVLCPLGSVSFVLPSC